MPRERSVDTDDPIDFIIPDAVGWTLGTKIEC